MLTADDRWAIADTLSNYCLAVDTRDFALLDSVLTEDVDCIFQTGAQTGRANVKDFISGVLATLTATQHNLTSSVVTGDGDHATGKTYLLVQHVKDGIEGGNTLLMGGTYHDEFRREPAGWRIARRQLIGTWRTGNPAVLARPSSAGVRPGDHPAGS
jgi:ketosteroid isomerase-like protein